jgi:cysteine desulfurase
MKKHIYLDHAATTPLHKKVYKAMKPYFTKNYGNPSSIYTLGQINNEAIIKAREQVAQALNANPSEIYFTGSGSEANNWAIKGIAYANKHKGNHIITSCIEHHSILNTCKQLEQEGFQITYLPVNENHQIDLEVFEKSLQNDTILVSIMAVNNETGSILNLKDIYKICKDRKIIMHSDFAQGFLKTDNELMKYCDMFTISSHKIHGLKSVAALIMNKNMNVLPIIVGGEQEYGIRSSTVDVPLIASFYKAIERNLKEKNQKYSGIAAIFDYCVGKINSIPYLVLNSNVENSTKYIVNFSFKENIKASIVLEYLSKKEIYVSSTSACNSKGEKISYVIYSLYGDEARAHNMIRLSFDETNTKEEIDILFDEIEKCVKGTLWKI